MSNFTNYVAAPMLGIALAFTSAAHATPILACHGHNSFIQYTVTVVNSANVTIDTLSSGDPVCVVDGSTASDNWVRIQYNRGDVGYDGWIKHYDVPSTSGAQRSGGATRGDAIKELLFGIPLGVVYAIPFGLVFGFVTFLTSRTKVWIAKKNTEV